MSWNTVVDPTIIRSAERMNNRLLSPPETAKRSIDKRDESEHIRWWERVIIQSTNAGPWVSQDTGDELVCVELTLQVDGSNSSDLTNAGQMSFQKIYYDPKALSDPKHPEHARATRAYGKLVNLVDACGLEYDPTTFRVGDWFADTDPNAPFPLKGHSVNAHFHEFTYNGRLKQNVEKFTR